MARIKIQDYINDVETNRQRLLKHIRENNIDVDNNTSLSNAITLNNQIETIPFEAPSDNADYKKEWDAIKDRTVEGPFWIKWVDLDGTLLYEEEVEYGGVATQWEGTLPVLEQYSDIIEFDIWEHAGDLNNVTRDILLVPHYNIKPDDEGNTWSHFFCDIDTSIEDTYTIPARIYSGSGSNTLYINWGDGTEIETHTITSSTKNISHTFTENGLYDIKIRLEKRYTSDENSNWYYYRLYLSGSLFGTSNNYLITNIFKAIFLDEKTFYNSSYLFSNMENLEIASIGKNNSSSFSFYRNLKLKVIASDTSLTIGTNGDASLIMPLKYVYNESGTLYVYTKYLLEDIYISCNKTTSLQMYATQSYSPSYSTYYNIFTPFKTNIYLPNSLTTLTLWNIYCDCITIPENVTSLNCKYSNIKKINFLTNNLTAISENCFLYNDSLQYIELPQNVQTLNSSAFAYCNNLIQVILPESTKTIGSYAFQDCVNLKFINTENITTINISAFYNCGDLESLDLSLAQTLDSSIFSGCNKLKTLITSDNLLTIKQSTFTTCPVNFIYLGNVLEIPKESFKSNKNIKEVIFSNNTLTLNDNIFYDCHNLENVDLSKSQVINLPIGCFFNCYNLKNVLLPSSVEHINANAFYCCKNLDTLDISHSLNLKSIGSNVLYYSNIKKLILPIVENLEIKEYGLNCCQELEEIVNLDKIKLNITGTQYYHYCFSNCKNLRKLNFKAGSSIFGYAFTEMKNNYIQELDLSECEITGTILQISHLYNLNKLILPNDFDLNIKLMFTSIWDDFENIISKLKDNTNSTAKTLTITSNQKYYLESKGLLEVLANKNWTVATASY